MGHYRAQATECRQTKLPYKATRPLLQLSSLTAAKTTHAAVGKHPARYLSHSRESATPYVRKSALKSGVKGGNGVLCSVER